MIILDRFVLVELMVLLEICDFFDGTTLAVLYVRLVKRVNSQN